MTPPSKQQASVSPVATARPDETAAETAEKLAREIYTLCFGPRSDVNGLENIVALIQKHYRSDEVAKLRAEVDSQIVDWLEDNCFYSGGGNGGTYSFKVTHDSENMRDALLATIKNS